MSDFQCVVFSMYRDKLYIEIEFMHKKVYFRTSPESLSLVLIFSLSFKPEDVTPSDYHLFQSMAHGLAQQHLRSYEKVKK